MPRFFKSRFMLVRYVGKDIYALPIPLWMIAFIFALIPSVVTAIGAFAIYQLNHDDVLNHIVSRHIAADYAYEEKIAAFRVQLDRIATHQLMDQNSLEGKVRDLMAREVVLENRAGIIASLVDQVSLPPDITSSISAKSAATADKLRTLAPANSPAQHVNDIAPKPHRNEPWMEQSSSLDKPVDSIIADLDQQFGRIEHIQNDSVHYIGATAEDTNKTLRSIITATGLSPQRIMPATLTQAKKDNHSSADQSAQGGPLVELATDPNGSQFERALHAMRSDILSAQYLMASLPLIPLHRPLINPLEQTSGFGMRIDPFTGRYALHTGLDFRDNLGAPVRSTAAGKVVFAGTSGGYGNMVEINHGNGISTRYGHLQAILVHEGDRVSIGTFIGQLGSTGRSTGPHLHYEVRIDGEAIDPSRFLQTGARFYQG